MADKKNLSWRDICTKYIMQAIMDAFAAHSTMNKQALDSERVVMAWRMCCWDLRSFMRRWGDNGYPDEVY